MTPGAEDQEVLMVCVMRLKRGVLDLRTEHVFLVVVATDCKRRHGNAGEMMFDAA